MTRRHQRMCFLWVWMTTHNIKGFNPSPSEKGSWLGVFQPNWQNYKIVISPAGNIGSIPNFDRVIEPHSWLRGWSRITKFVLKMADGRHIPKCWKRYNSPINGRIWMKRGWRIPSWPDMSSIMRLAWQRPLPSNGALYSQQLWASGGRTREPILLKFGLQQQIRTIMTVTWSNIKIFIIQNGGRPPCWKIFEIP